MVSWVSFRVGQMKSGAGNESCSFCKATLNATWEEQGKCLKGGNLNIHTHTHVHKRIYKQSTYRAFLMVYHAINDISVHRSLCSLAQLCFNCTQLEQWPLWPLQQHRKHKQQEQQPKKQLEATTFRMNANCKGKQTEKYKVSWSWSISANSSSNNNSNSKSNNNKK